MSPARDRTSRNIWLAVTAVVVTTVDQLSKAWAVTALEDEIIDVVSTLRLRLVHNTGFAFSAGKGLGPVLALAAIVIVGVLWSSRRRVHGSWPTVGLGAIIGGALGNLGDRVFRGDGWGSGGVVDFIDVQWWPIFNLADAGITIGLAGLLVHLYRSERRSRTAS
ncbi:signal peptidase II [Candidatus Poriferisodalis sp.]|uniref:signal peptidase II n=1 Tax=Candidatus Poriferisodalis sp. TaxID=3101277 RepID=UPI003D0FECC6